MKKLLGISLVAMMAVTSANAEIASKAYVDQREAAAVSTANTYTNTKIGNIAATDVATEIANAITGANLDQYELLNNVKSKGAADTPVYFDANGVAAPITSYAGKAATAGVADSANEVAWSGVQNTPTTLAGYGIADAYTKDAADAKFDTIAHVGTIPAGSSAETVIGYVDEKTAASTAGMLTTSNYATTLDPVYVNANEVTDEYAANGTAPVTGTAVNAAITGLNLANTYQAKGEYATAAQGALADSALQKADIASGTANGTIKVDGTDVAVTGLGGAAYQDVATTVSSDNTTAPVSGSAVAAAISTAGDNYATSAQGALADSALQKADIASGTANGTIKVDGTDVAVTGLKALAYKDTVVSADITDGTIESADIKDGAVILAKLGGTLPTECTGANPTHECVLKSTASGLGWEKIQRSTTGE